MSPSEIINSQSTANSLHRLNAAGNIKKSSSRLNFSKARRSSDLYISSPLTPWEDETTLKRQRKSSLKFHNRQGKNVKTNTKDIIKKKDKKLVGKSIGFPVYFANCNEGNEKLSATNFRYHSDIGQYMREYRELRNAIAAGHRDCSCHGTYGPEEIDKAYDSLGIPKLMQRSRILTSNKKTTLPPVKDIPVINQDTAEYEESDSESTSDSSTDPRKNNQLASPDARERRNNLNLSPLRKQVRLPDSSNFPVQTVSGLGIQELARLATTRSELKQIRGRAVSDSVTPKLRYSSSDKRFLSTALHLQEKTLCRVIELSLPEVCGAENSNEEKKEKQTASHSSDHHKVQRHASKAEMSLLSTSPLDPTSVSRLQKLDLGEPQDDALTIAIGTSRSCQSSVLSNAVSSLSSRPCSFSPHRAQTVKEMLTSSVQDLHPFSKNGTQIQRGYGGTEGSTDKLSSQESIDSHNIPKQLVSLQTYRNLSYKPSMKTFMEELYSPEKEHPMVEKNESCLVAGKQLRHLNTLSSHNLSPYESKEYSRLTVKLERTSRNSPQSESATKVFQRARERHEAGECYEPIRRVVTLETKRTPNPAKLAILSKCHTVVKPQVSVRGVAI